MRAKQECNTHALPMHMACSWLCCRIGRLAPSPAFCILHSSFCLRSHVALGWLWGRNPLAINTLCGGFDVALGGLRRYFCFPAILHSTFFILHSPRAQSAGALPPRFQRLPARLPAYLARQTSRPG